MEFITAEEHQSLKDRLNDLTTKRSELVERIAEARAKGDLKENADYHAAREDHAFNERIIKDLEEKLKVATVADTSSMPDDMVFVGATVRLRDVDSGSEEVFRLVGEPKVDLDAEVIEVSTNSPMGQSLMRSRVGEIVRVDLPRGTKQYEIVALL